LLTGGKKYRGDGAREKLERIAIETGVFTVTCVLERSRGTLYCAVVYVDPVKGTVSKRRKVQPTGLERLIWGQGQARQVKAISALCWELYMPLLRQALYQQNINMLLALTSVERENWMRLTQTIGFEGRTFVVSSNVIVTDEQLPNWINEKERTGKIVNTGGSCIISSSARY
jgi:nitrilase